VRSALTSERVLLAEYEALGVSRTTLARSVQLRLVALSALGIAAGFIGGLLAVRLVGALVAVTGTAARPLPPIEPVVAWRTNLATAGAVAAAAIVTAGLLARRAVRGAAAGRLRA
jgi:ABC-type antimicrobial peptide transport system permease subunit